MLVRFWSTSDLAQRFADEFAGRVKELADEVPDEPILFRVRRTFYDGWSRHDEALDERQIAKFDPTIRSLAKVDAVDSRELLDEVEGLRKLRLLHEIDPQEHGLGGKRLLKLYVALQGERVRMSIEEEVRHVRSAVSAWKDVSMTSIYYGSAPETDLRCLVKAVVPVESYPDIVDAIDALNGLLEREYIEWRTTTLLIASKSPPESDVLDPDHTKGDTLLLHQLARMLSDRARSVIYVSEHRHEAQAIFSDFRSALLDTPFERYFLGVLEAGVLGDPLLLEERLLFFFHIDNWINRWLGEELFPTQWGPEWKAALREAIAEANARREAAGRSGRPVRLELWKSGMSEMAEGLGELAAMGAIDISQAGSIFPDDWLGRLDQVKEDRNKLAHGRLAQSLQNDFAAAWPATARRALNVGTIYNALYERFAGS